MQKLETYRDELEINAEFEAARPELFGALLDLFVKTLEKLPHIELTNPPRMAGFARLGEAMAQAMGHKAGTFDRIFKENRHESISRAMEASPVALAIRELAESCQGAVVFHGTVKKLYDDLSSGQHSRESWPRSSRGFGDAIRRQTPALASIGIEVVQTGRQRQGMSILIKRTEEATPSECSENEYKRATQGI